MVFNKRNFLHLITVPFIWVPFIPTLLVHALMALYQFVSFPIYGLEKVRLRDYLNFDRRKLKYIKGIDKINCAYCAYANAVFTYFSEIAHRTEFYWCGVKHRDQPENPAFAYQEKFAPYGDKKSYEKHLDSTRRRK